MDSRGPLGLVGMSIRLAYVDTGHGASASDVMLSGAQGDLLLQWCRMRRLPAPAPAGIVLTYDDCQQLLVGATIARVDVRNDRWTAVELDSGVVLHGQDARA